MFSVFNGSLNENSLLSNNRIILKFIFNFRLFNRRNIFLIHFLLKLTYQVIQSSTPTPPSDTSQRLDFSNLREHFKAPSSNNPSSNNKNQTKAAKLNYKSDFLPNLSLRDNVLLQNSHTIEKSNERVVNAVLAAKYNPVITKPLSQWLKGSNIIINFDSIFKFIFNIRKLLIDDLPSYSLSATQYGVKLREKIDIVFGVNKGTLKKLSLTKSLTLEQISIIKAEMEQYIVSKNGVPNSHDISWRNAVKAIDQERFATNLKFNKIISAANEDIENGQLR